MRSCDAKLGHLDIRCLATSWISILRPCRQYRPAERRVGWRYLQARDVSCRCVKAGPRDPPVVPQRRTGPLAQPPLRVGSNDIEVPAGRRCLDEPSEAQRSPMRGDNGHKADCQDAAGTGGTQKKFPLPFFCKQPMWGGGRPASGPALRAAPGGPPRPSPENRERNVGVGLGEVPDDVLRHLLGQPVRVDRPLQHRSPAQHHGTREGHARSRRADRGGRAGRCSAPHKGRRHQAADPGQASPQVPLRIVQ
jgi:hypothetical protein